jgi:hypothetical protein
MLLGPLQSNCVGVLNYGLGCAPRHAYRSHDKSLLNLYFQALNRDKLKVLPVPWDSTTDTGKISAGETVLVCNSSQENITATSNSYFEQEAA